MKKIITSIFFLAAVLTMLSCGNKADLDSNGIPGKLVIAVYAGGDNPAATKAGLQPLKKYFEEKLGMEVEYNFGTDYNSIIEAVEAKKAHIAYLSPFSYVLASQKHNITPIVCLGENGKPAMYHSLIFTNPKTGINNIDDLKAKAKNLSLCFSEPASTSGHLIPRAYLNTIGLDPDHAFKQVIFAGSHAASILSVSSGKIDVGCTTLEYGLQKVERAGMVKPDQIKYLWLSDAIVSSPVVVRNDLNKDFAKKIQNLYLNMAKDNPPAFQGYIKLYHPNNLTQLTYMTVQDSMYNGLRKIAKGIKDLNVGN